MPLFTGGQVGKQVDVARARAEQARYSYEQTVLLALRDVKDALAGVRATRDVSAAQDRQTEALRAPIISPTAATKTGSPTTSMCWTPSEACLMPSCRWRARSANSWLQRSNSTRRWEGVGPAARRPTRRGGGEDNQPSGALRDRERWTTLPAAFADAAEYLPE